MPLLSEVPEEILWALLWAAVPSQSPLARPWTLTWGLETSQEEVAETSFFFPFWFSCPDQRRSPFGGRRDSLLPQEVGAGLGEVPSVLKEMHYLHTVKRTDLRFIEHHFSQCSRRPQNEMNHFIYQNYIHGPVSTCAWEGIKEILKPLSI